MIHPPRRRPLIVVHVVPEPIDRRVAERRHQVRAHALAELVVLQVAQEPRAARVPRLELQRPVQLRGVPHHLVAEQRVVVGIGHHHHVLIGSLQGLARGQGHRVPSQIQREVHQMGELDEFALQPAGDQLPTALVAREVVQFLVTVLPLGHHEATPLGDSPRLLDVRSLGADE